MKRTLSTLTLLLSLTVVFTACGKDDSASPSDNTNNNNNNNNPEPETPGMFVKVNFQDKTAGTYNAVFKDGGVTITGNISNLAIVLKANADKTGTYTTKIGTGHEITYAGVYTTEIEDGDGKITISKIDTDKKTVSGTFNAIVYEPGNDIKTYLTEGKFVSIPYTEE